MARVGLQRHRGGGGGIPVLNNANMAVERKYLLRTAELALNVESC